MGPGHICSPVEPEPRTGREDPRLALPRGLRERLRSGRELARRRAEAPPAAALPTALAAFDELLAGGLPRGRLVELTGRLSSGRFSTVVAALSAATRRGEATALVDLGDAFDPQAAAAAEADLERLLWVRPVSMRQALISAELLLGSGFPLVIVDLGNPPVSGGRGTPAAWLRLARAAATQRAALLVSSPYRVSGVAAALVIRSRRQRFAWSGSRSSPRLLQGLRSRLSLEKSDGRWQDRWATLDLAAAQTAPGGAGRPESGA